MRRAQLLTEAVAEMKTIKRWRFAAKQAVAIGRHTFEELKRECDKDTLPDV